MSSVLNTLRIVDHDCDGGYRIINETELTAEDTLFGATVSKSLTIGELREALTAKGIEFDPATKKADLQTLLDAG